jgi:anaphase-promoting complex subunit 4
MCLKRSHLKVCVGSVSRSYHHLTLSVVLFRITHSRLFDEVPKSVEACDAAILDFGTKEVLDVRFLDDENLLILTRTSEDDDDEGGISHLIQYPYRQHKQAADSPFKPVQGALSDMTLLKGAFPKPQTILSLSEPKSASTYVKQTFRHRQNAFRPVKLQVTGRKHRRVCVILADDQKQVRIYDLSESANGAIPGIEAETDLEMDK